MGVTTVLAFRAVAWRFRPAQILSSQIEDAFNTDHPARFRAMPAVPQEIRQQVRADDAIVFWSPDEPLHIHAGVLCAATPHGIPAGCIDTVIIGPCHGKGIPGHCRFRIRDTLRKPCQPLYQRRFRCSVHSFSFVNDVIGGFRLISHQEHHIKQFPAMLAHFPRKMEKSFPVFLTFVLIDEDCLLHLVKCYTNLNTYDSLHIERK